METAETNGLRPFPSLKFLLDNLASLPIAAYLGTIPCNYSANNQIPLKLNVTNLATRPPKHQKGCLGGHFFVKNT